MSAGVNQRTAAEARRQKLLARGSERLNQIIQGKPQSEQQPEQVIGCHCALQKLGLHAYRQARQYRNARL